MKSRTDLSEEQVTASSGHGLSKKKTAAIALAVIALLIAGACFLSTQPLAPARQGSGSGSTQRDGSSALVNAASANADTDAVDEQTEGAAESAQSGDSTAKGSGNGGSTGSTAKPSGNGGSGSSGSSSGNGSDAGSKHSHNWVAQTKTVHHDAQYKTVHHDAQYQTVHHDAVTEYRCICNSCGADITSNPSAHMKEWALQGDNSHTYSNVPVVVQGAYDEQVLVQAAYDEQVLVSGAWDETVTTGYACSCGATK